MKNNDERTHATYDAAVRVSCGSMLVVRMHCARVACCAQAPRAPRARTAPRALLVLLLVLVLVLVLILILILVLVLVEACAACAAPWRARGTRGACAQHATRAQCMRTTNIDPHETRTAADMWHACVRHCFHAVAD